MTTTPLPPNIAQMIQPGGIVPIDIETTAALVAEIKRQQQALANLEAEVARLREALQVLVDNGGIGPEWMFDDARAALEGTK